MASLDVLIGIPSPRDIPEFLDAMKQIPESKVWVKYLDEYTAYNIIRSYFLESEHTHLCILPDDLIVTPAQFNKLKETAKNYPILSGTCAIDSTTTELTTRIGDRRVKRGEGIMKVDYEGFSCCFLRRDVVEQIRFDTDYGPDIALEKQCRHLNIPIHVDLSTELKHLRFPGKLQYCGIGLKDPAIIFDIMETVIQETRGTIIF